MPADLELRLLNRVTELVKNAPPSLQHQLSVAARKPWETMRCLSPATATVPMVTAVLVSEQPQGAEGILRDLRGLDLPAAAFNTLCATPLPMLGMVSVRMPAFPALLDVLRELSHVAMVGDGDARCHFGLPASGPDLPFQTGGWGAASRTLCADPLALRQVREALALRNEALVRVAVIDSGIDAEGASFRRGDASLVVARQVFTEKRSRLLDASGHGTHVASLIGGLATDAPEGYAGLATEFVNRRLAAATDGSGLLLNVLRGMSWALENEVAILNLSLGAMHPPGVNLARSLEWMAVQAAHRAGVLVVAAAGNDGTHFEGPCLASPADAAQSIAVAAIQADRTRASFSSRGPSSTPLLSGPKPNVAAPGVQIVGARARTASDDARQLQWVAMSGTSMAAPILTGLLALALGHLRCRKLALPPTQLHRALRESCILPEGETADHLGAGLPQWERLEDRLEYYAGRERRRPASASLEGDTGGGSSGAPAAERRFPTTSVEPPPLDFPNWRERETTLINHLCHRIETALKATRSDFFPKKFLDGNAPPHIDWVERDEAIALRALLASGALTREAAERLPLRRWLRGKVCRGKRVCGELLILSRWDWQSLLQHQAPPPLPVEPSFLQGVTYAVIFGHASQPPSLPAALPYANLYWDADAWQYTATAAEPPLWPLFFPETDASCLNRVERLLDRHCPALASEVAEQTNLPVSMLKALVQGSARYEYRDRFQDGQDLIFAR